jgi:hypothetical protein
LSTDIHNSESPTQPLLLLLDSVDMTAADDACHVNSCCDVICSAATDAQKSNERAAASAAGCSSQTTANQTSRLRRICHKHTETTKAATRNHLFRFADKLDVFLMFLAVTCSLAHGVGHPLLVLVFGDMTTTFIKYTPHPLLLFSVITPN